MQDFAHVLGNAVKKARYDLKLTQSEVADSIQADERTIANIEHYKGNPKLEILWPLLRALSIDANAVFYPEQNETFKEALQFQVFLSQCSEDEIQLLFPICQSVIAAYRSSQGKYTIKKK